jgi:hypothetical protein
MLKSINCFLGALLIGVGVLVMGVLAYRAAQPGAVTTGFLWGMFPAMAIEGWLVFRAVRCLGAEGRSVSKTGGLLGVALLIGYFGSIGLWILVLLRPFAEAAKEAI